MPLVITVLQISDVLLVPSALRRFSAYVSLFLAFSFLLPRPLYLSFPHSVLRIMQDDPGAGKTESLCTMLKRRLQFRPLPDLECIPDSSNYP